MITYYSLGSFRGAACHIGVDDQDSKVKHVRIDMAVATHDVTFTLYSAPNVVAFQRLFVNDGLESNVTLDQSEWVPYATEMMQVPATGEWVEVMTEPGYTWQ